MRFRLHPRLTQSRIMDSLTQYRTGAWRCHQSHFLPLRLRQLRRRPSAVTAVQQQHS